MPQTGHGGVCHSGMSLLSPYIEAHVSSSCYLSGSPSQPGECNDRISKPRPCHSFLVSLFLASARGADEEEDLSEAALAPLARDISASLCCKLITRTRENGTSTDNSVSPLRHSPNVISTLKGREVCLFLPYTPTHTPPSPTS